MKEFYMVKLRETNIVLESTSEEQAPSIEEFKADYNAAYDAVSEDENLSTPTEELEGLFKILIASRKYRLPIYTGIIIMEEELDTADVINDNIITTADEDTPGFTMEQLDSLSDKF